MKRLIIAAAFVALAAPAHAVTPAQGSAHARYVLDETLRAVPLIAAPEACGVVSHLQASLALEQMAQGAQALAVAYGLDPVPDVVGPIRDAERRTIAVMTPERCRRMTSDQEGVFQLQNDIDAMGRTDGVTLVQGLLQMRAEQGQ